MNENAKAWVEALRSGKYQQAQRALRVDDAYCCLGVACILYKETTGQGEWVADKEMAHPDGTKCTPMDYRLTPLPLYFNTGYLPDEVRRWIGLRNNLGLVPNEEDLYNCEYLHNLPKENLSLAALNDSGCTFDQIANAIESNSKDLFHEELPG